jgi:hypothetical protein
MRAALYATRYEEFRRPIRAFQAFAGRKLVRIVSMLRCVT